MIPAVLLALVTSFLTLRYGLKDDYFLFFTSAVMVVMALIFSKIQIAGGAIGISISFVKSSWARMVFIEKEPYLYICLGLLFIGLLVNFLVARSRLGRYLVAIRESEDGAKALGVDVSRYKTYSLVIAAALNALGGGFYMVYTTFIDPPLVFGGTFNFELLIAPIIGGRGTVLGPLLGAILNKPFVELIRGFFSVSRAGTTLMIYGAFLMIFILFLPRGVIGLFEPPYRRFRQRMLKKLTGAGRSAATPSDTE
jgi:branched-chain amino acid transport system permease protein